MVKIFVSFARPGGGRDAARRMVDLLKAAGHDARMEDDMGVRSPSQEMLDAIYKTDVVLALVTEHFPRSPGATREIEYADAFGKPVIAAFLGLDPRSDLAIPYRVYRRVEATGAWTGSDEQWKELAGLALRALETVQGATSPGTGGRTGEPAAQPPAVPEVSLVRPDAIGPAVVLSDVEDFDVVRRVLAQRPEWVRQFSPGDRPDLPRVVLWTDAAGSRATTLRDAIDRLPSSTTCYYLAVEDASPVPPGAKVDWQWRRDAGARNAQRTLYGRVARDRVNRLNAEVLRLNDGIPLDVLVERFCASGAVVDRAIEAFGIARAGIPANDPVRLTAALNNVLARRFVGEWKSAVEAAQSEINATSVGVSREVDRLRLRLALEEVSLSYELGDRHPAESIEAVRALQLQFRDSEDLPGYVQAGRVLANVYREQGDFQQAVKVLERTSGVAEYLAEHVPENSPNEIVLADCHRDLAVLYIATREMKLARESLSSALSLLEGGPANAAVRYLTGGLRYVEATLAEREDEPARSISPAENALQALVLLSGFENPIRLASVYDWLGRSLTRKIPRSSEDLQQGEAYLRKALRIRSKDGHAYARALSHLSLGNLYISQTDLDNGIDQYEEARRIFNERGLQPALAKAHAALARAYNRKISADGDEASQRYAENLAEAERLFHAIGLGNEALELRFELEHSGRRAIAEVSDDAPLIAVGEYLLHRWIRDVATPNLGLDRNFELSVGIGDDAAVLRAVGLPPEYGLVLTTDAAPGSLARLPKDPALARAKAEYVGRFAVVMSIADLLAMGAKPVGLLLNLFLSRAATVGYTCTVIEAVVREARRYGATILGGDVKERDEQSVGVVAIGYVDSQRALTRSAARPGHALCVTLASSPTGGSRQIGARWTQELIENYITTNPDIARMPELRGIINPSLKYDLLYLPDRVMDAAMRTGLLRAGMDTSDGVLSCLEVMGRQSGVGFELDETQIGRIIGDDARRFAEVLGIPPSLFLFSAGHDWEIVCTCPEDRFDDLAGAVDGELRGNGSIVRIGTVVERRPEDEHGVRLRRSDGSVAKVGFYTDEKFLPRAYQDRPSQWLGWASRLQGQPSAGPA
jgi:thiamine-monophosphate kinase